MAGGDGVRDAAVGLAAGAVERRSGVGDRSAVASLDEPGGGSQGVAGGVRDVGCGCRVAAGEGAELAGAGLGGRGGAAVGVEPGSRVVGRRCGGGAWWCAVPPPAELRPGQIARELAATEPDRTAVPAAVPGKGDGVPGHLAGDEFAVPLADEQPGPLEAAQELVRRRGCGCGGADLASEPDPRRLATTRALRLLRLAAGGSLRRRAVSAGGSGQAEPLLHDAAGLADLVEVVRQRDPLPVLPSQRDNEVDVVVGVSDGDPATAAVVIARRQPGPVEDLLSDVAPLLVAESPVSWCCPKRAVPDRLRRCAAQRQGLLEEASQLAKLWLAVRGSRWLEQIGAVIPRPDKMWVLVLVAASWSVQVVEKPSDATASEDLPDHASLASSQFTILPRAINCDEATR